jgi:hypothetical protein
MNWFMLKIKLDPKNFIEQDNFVTYNSVETKDARVNFLSTENQFEFVNFYQGTPFVDRQRKAKFPNATFDNKTFETVTFNRLYQSNFFYSSMMYEHSRTLRSWVDVISDWGGLQQFIFSFLGISFSFVNERFK